MSHSSIVVSMLSAILAMMVVVFGVVIRASVGWTNIKATIKSLETTLVNMSVKSAADHQDHETRLRLLEQRKRRVF